MQTRLSSTFQEIRSIFAHGGWEALRAYSFFGALLLVLVVIVGQLAFRELSLKVLAERLDLGQYEAGRIAAAVETLGRSHRPGVDFSGFDKRGELLHRYVLERFSKRSFINYVEVTDRFGGRQFLAARTQSGPRPEDSTLREVEELPTDWPDSEIQVVRVPLSSASGEVRLGVSQVPLLDELRVLRNSLRFKLALAATVGVVVLVAGLFYVLYLIRKNRGLERARQSADRASYVGLLASGLAHEIRNPLNAMNINLQMLEEELRAEPGFEHSEHAELVESTKQEIQRLEQLVQNFLTFARPSAPRFEPRDVNAVVGDVIRLLEIEFRQSRIEVRQELSQLLPKIELDETMFKQALINLLVNAKQVLRARDDGRIRVTTRPGPSGEIVLEIDDNGPGIPGEMRERIFEVFYSSRGGGTGLGLPIARQIVERHGGTIELQTEQGRGTTFRIRLPRRHQPAAGRPSRDHEATR